MCIRDREYVEKVLDDNPANWKLESTLGDIRKSIELVENEETKRLLSELANQLAKEN